MSAESLNSLNWLAQTKFSPPMPGPNLVVRPRLADFLRSAVLAKRLSLVSAPAGFGKTTLLAQAFYWNNPQTAGLRLAWLGLDEEDNDPVYFLSGLLTALRRISPHFGTSIQSQLAALNNSGTEYKRLVVLLTNEIIEALPDPFVLILDDLHWITNPLVHQLLDYWLERLPAQMRLVIASRYDPGLSLSRLRARGQIAEIRLEQLRFTSEEVAHFLDERALQTLPQTQLEEIVAQTEGWAAALQMLSNSLNPLSVSVSDKLNPEASEISKLRLLETKNSLFEYLADEVLNKQSLEERTFLLEISILAEITPELCEAVTGRDDAAQILERLYRRNLFLTLVDIQGPTYRYHDMFADFLQHRVQNEMPGAIAVLHKCAAHAYGETQPWPMIRHLLAGQWWDEAAQAIEQTGISLLQQGMLAKLQSWIEALPLAISTQRPRLKYFRGIYTLRQGKLEEARHWLQEALEHFETDGTELEQAETLLQLATSYTFGGDFQRSEQCFERALSLALPLKMRVILISNHVYLSAIRQDWPQFVQERCQLIDLALKADDPEIYNIKAFFNHTIAMLVPGLLDTEENYYREVLKRLKGKDSFIEGNALNILGYIDLVRGRFEPSVEKLVLFKQITKPADLNGLHYADMVILQTMQQQWQGKYQEIDALYRKLIPELAQVEIFKPWLALSVYTWASANYHLGRPEVVREVQTVILELAYPQERPECEVARIMTQALVEMGEARYAEAEQTLKRAIELQQRLLLSLACGFSQLLLAELYRKWNRLEQALQQLAPILAECEAQNKPGLILWEGPAMVPLLKLAVENGVHSAYATRLLAMVGVEVGIEVKPRALRIPGSAETISARELEVLRLIMLHATNREIAEKLVISEVTVKTHVSRILQKLGLNSRNKVAARARELGLI